MSFRVQTETSTGTIYYAKRSHPSALTTDAEKAEPFASREEANTMRDCMHNPALWEVHEIRDHTPSASGEGY